MIAPPPIQLASLGWADSLILMVLALVVFGPRRLPQIGRQIGKLMYEFRKASNDFKFQKEEEERQKALAAPPAAPTLAATSLDAPAQAVSAPGASPYPGEAAYPPITT